MSNVGGHLVKRVTHIIRERSYGFEIVEQNLALRGIRLLGGDYTLRVQSQDCTRVALATHYASLNFLAGCSAVLKPPSVTRFTVTFCPRCGATSDALKIIEK